MNFPAASATPAADHDKTPARSRGLPALIVFSALRWNFDTRRPQHLLTRLAKHYRVIVVEEPVTTYADAYLANSAPSPGVELLVPHTRVDAAGFHDDQLPVLRALLADFIREQGIVQPIAWLYTPMALPLAQSLVPRCVIVDVMEDFAAARHAGAASCQREDALMQRADVVLAAGPSLYQARRALNSNVHCIPNAVDPEHFAPAALAGTTIAAVSARSIHAAIPNPRLGFFGVIDERIDFDLLARVADLRPDWQLVMAGPLAGIDPAALPRRPNIHWIGPQTYAILPHLQAHWDVCMLPLKCDAAARHESPPQALAYLAGQKSVVSTPAHDVVALYGHIVRFAPDANGFVEACRAALTERGPLRRQRRIDALIAVHSSTWDRAAERVHKLLVEAAPARAAVGAAAVPDELVAAQALQVAAGRQRYAMR
jgi:UDP-galactopyranose mutase